MRVVEASPTGNSVDADTAIAGELDYLRVVESTLIEWSGPQDESAYSPLAETAAQELAEKKT